MAQWSRRASNCDVCIYKISIVSTQTDRAMTRKYCYKIQYKLVKSKIQ